MLKKHVKIGGMYRAKVSGVVCDVQIVSENRHGGWNGVNLATGKSIHVKSAQRLRSEIR